MVLGWERCAFGSGVHRGVCRRRERVEPVRVRPRGDRNSSMDFQKASLIACMMYHVNFTRVYVSEKIIHGLSLHLIYVDLSGKKLGMTLSLLESSLANIWFRKILSLLTFFACLHFRWA